jgi:glycosyltransferase involved in cell wall biosynthesis
MFANAGWENERKNYGLAVNSFIKAFGNSTNVELVLKVTTGEVPGEILKKNNITVIRGRFSKEKLRELIYSCDCLLSPTASEGYGLPQREAMATGIPVIAVNYSGLEPIMSLDFNYPVEYTEVSSDYWKVPHFVAFNLGSKDLGVWAKPRLESIVAQLRKAADNKKILLAKGEECSVWINENETSERAAKTLLDIIRSKNP